MRLQCSHSRERSRVAIGIFLKRLVLLHWPRSIFRLQTFDMS